MIAITRADLGVDPNELRVYVVRTALQRIGLWSAEAENIVLGTAIHESRLRALMQTGRDGKPGPAIGLWQMEQPTHDDCWRNFIASRFRLNQALRELVTDGRNDEIPAAAQLAGNLYYAAAMCRIVYLRQAGALPSDPDGMAALWKLSYNSSLGAGTIEQALPAFQFACAT
jgi:hypothetical protein